MRNMIFDIRNPEVALKTLCNLTGVPEQRWNELANKSDFGRINDDKIDSTINMYGHMPADYREFDFIYFHVTTSANQCKYFRANGILDLAHSYSCNDSELRIFLDTHGIYIDLENRTLTYRNNVFDITFYDSIPRSGTKAYNQWLIGRKFYYDYTTCGFLSIANPSSYGGAVHLRPEILHDIDNLLGLELSNEWRITHQPFEIVAKISGRNVVYCGWDDEASQRDKVLFYLSKAYSTAFFGISEVILLVENGVQILPQNIIEINHLW